jgi:8-oxo-dGTP pyrophosphatase MutT (NUDIX family)
MNKDLIISKIVAYQPQLIDETPVSAAVLVFMMYDQDENLSILVTKRPDHLATYAGDYCFPGGTRESFDPDLQATAIRETEEELGLQKNHYEVIGQLDDFVDRYGNLVRTYFAVISKDDFEQKAKNSSDEVASIFYLPLPELLKIQPDIELEKITKRHPTYRYTQDAVVIWGLTASIMVHLSNIIFQLDKPVSIKKSTL